MAAGFSSLPYLKNEWLLENFYNFTSTNFWPPNLSDCNLVVYYRWDMIEKGTNSSACNTTKARLMAKSKEVIDILPRDTVMHVPGSEAVLRPWWNLRVATLL